MKLPQQKDHRLLQVKLMQPQGPMGGMICLGIVTAVRFYRSRRSHSDRVAPLNSPPLMMEAFGLSPPHSGAGPQGLRDHGDRAHRLLLALTDPPISANDPGCPSPGTACNATLPDCQGYQDPPSACKRAEDESCPRMDVSEQGCGLTSTSRYALSVPSSALVLADTLIASSPVRELSSILHAVTVWGNECWRPIGQLSVPVWIRQLLPFSPEARCVGAPVAYHVYTDGSAEGGRAGWGAILVAEYAAVDCYRAVAFAGHCVLESDGPPSFSACTNNAAEAWALLITQLAALALPVQLPLTFWVDSRVTIGSATGLMDPACIQGDPALSGAVRASAQALQQRPAPTQWHWVPGHSRVAFNEMADHVAGLAARGKISSPIPWTVRRLARHAMLPWAWRLLARNSEVPELDRLAAGRYEPYDALPSKCVQAIIDDVQLPACESTRSLPCRMLTANLCTGAGKQVPLMAQLDDAHVDVAFFQETRSRSSRQCSGRWLQFCAAASRGQGGCSIWIRQGWRTGSRPIARTDCTVLVARADLIAVRVRAAGCSLLLVNLHGPHSQRPLSEISDWWGDALATVKALRGEDFLVVGGDFNARLGPSSGCTGEHGPDTSDAAGEHVEHFCNVFGLCLANTYEAVMGGFRATTWKDRRLDYIAVPAPCLCSCQVVDLAFDLLNPHEDHQALCLDFSLPSTSAQGNRGASAKTGRSVAGSRAHLGRDAHRAADVLSAVSARTREWGTNIHEHANDIFCQAQQVLDAMPSGGAYPNKPFTSPAAMGFIQQRKWCDKLLARLDADEHVLLLRRSFVGWRSSLHTGAAVCAPSCSSIHRARAVCLKARSIWCSCVRRQLRLDKAEYVEGLCAELNNAACRRDTAELFAKLRCFRPASKRVFKPFGPLDILRKPGGGVAGSYEEQQELRGAHFGSMEAALVQTAEEFAQGDVLPMPLSGGYRMLLDVEQVVRSLPGRKAPGPSGTPNEIWKASPATAAGLWLPVVLKQHVRLTEPVRFSTGILATLFKGKGDPSCIEAHRSIFWVRHVGR